MKFADYIATLPEIEDYEVEITLSSGESITIPNIQWKQASLRLLQAHLMGEDDYFDLENFCEYYQEWKQDPNGHHTTITFLDRYNKEGWTIKKI